jgi:hypothetical protein
MSSRRAARLALACGCAGAFLAAGPAIEGAARAADAPVFSLAVGYNGVPPDAPQGLAPLRFADDDAASFHAFASTLSVRSLLLAMMDKDTQQRFPDASSEARPPSLAELRRAVGELRVEVDASVAKGAEPVVLIFYSGHGTRGADGQGALSLLDGELTRDMLYDEVLAPLHARFVHLFIDACNAEAVVRPRDLQAQVVDPPPAGLRDYLHGATLARFPNVGAVMASTGGAQSHEWDLYQSGIFTHEILSALRGAADVDGNRRIEYSELAAFLAAANRDVADVRARPHGVIHPPPADPRVAIVDLKTQRRAAFLTGKPGALGSFYVEDARGNRLLDLRAEPLLSVTLSLPAEGMLYVRNDRGEAAMSPLPGATVRFEDLRLAATEVRARGALDSALRRGLFATRYGPDYYRGFVDRSDELVPVPLSEADLVAQAGPAGGEPPGPRRLRRAAFATYAGAGALAIGAGVFGVLAVQAKSDFDGTMLERPALDAKARYEHDLGWSVGLLSGAVVAAATATYLLWRSEAP